MQQNNSNKRILYICHRFHPFKGGAEQNLLSFATRSAMEGHSVSVYTSNFPYREEKLKKLETYKNISIVRLNSFFSKFPYMWFAPGLLKNLLKNDFDIIHVSGIGFLWVEICLVLRKIVNRKSQTLYINTPHGPFMAFQKKDRSIRGILKTIGDFYLSKIVWRLYSKVIAVVNNQGVWLQEIYKFRKNQIIVIPNGIDSAILEETVPTTKDWNEIGIVFTGRMEWYKGIQDVLTSLYILKTQYQTKHIFKFYIMGRSGNFTKSLQNQIKQLKLEENVEIIFSPDDFERDEIYKTCQICILPSKWEGTGIVLLEAMAKGNVVISTFQNDAVDIIIKEGVTGYAYNFGDENKLAEILHNLFENPELRKNIIEHNIRYAKHFTWDSVFPIYREEVLEYKNISATHKN